jgi:hypothetical protein
MAHALAVTFLLLAPLVASAQAEVPPPSATAGDVSAPSEDAPAAPEGRRGGWYASFALGGADAIISMNGVPQSFTMFTSRRDERAGMASLGIGKALGPRWLLGAELGAVTAVATSGISSNPIVHLDAVGTFFPTERGLFVRGGLGPALLVRRSGWGTGALDVRAGAGYAWSLGRSVNLTLGLDAARQIYVTSREPDYSSYTDLYLGLGWY